MLTCSKCGEEKDKSEFSKDKSTSTGFAWWCRLCISKRDKKHYKSNKNAVKQATAARHRKNKERLDEWKHKQGCCCCPETSACCLDLHHLDSEQKEMGVSDLVKRRSWERLQEELQKCVVICSNCHRKIHAGLLTLK